MSDLPLDTNISEAVPNSTLDTALRNALADAEIWQCLLDADAEAPDSLLSPDQLGFFPGMTPDIATIAMTTEEDQTGSWAIGLAGHGIGNLYFCCKLRFPRLKAAICIPYGNPFGTQQEALTNRQTIRTTCNMIAFLLRAAIAKRNFAYNNSEARLTVLCDRNGTQYQIDDHTGALDKGTSWAHLLEEYFNPDFSNFASLQFFIG